MNSSLSPRGSASHFKNERMDKSHACNAVRENIVVAVNAGREITRHALEWALNNVAQAGDHITVVALLQGRNGNQKLQNLTGFVQHTFLRFHLGDVNNLGWKLWNLPRFGGECANRSVKGARSSNSRDLEDEVSDSCSVMMQQLHQLCDSKQVKVGMRVIPGAVKGAVAIEADRVKASWVVLDSQLKKEESKCCMEQLQCNLVVVKRSDAKILRLNLKASSDVERPAECPASEVSTAKTRMSANSSTDEAFVHRGVFDDLISSTHDKCHTICEEAGSSGSPGGRTLFTATDKGTSSASSSELSTSPLTRNKELSMCAEQREDDSLIVETDSESDYECGDLPLNSSDDESNQLSLGRRPVSRTTNASPEHRFGGSSVRYNQSSDLMSEAWFDYNSALGKTAKRESYSVDPWMPTTMIRANSASATPRAYGKRHGRATTPASPNGHSNCLAGNNRLSLSMREGGSGVLQSNPSVEGVKVPGQAYQRSYLNVAFSDTKSRSGAQRFNIDKGNCVKGALATKGLVDRLSSWDPDSAFASEFLNNTLPRNGDFERTSSVRRAMSLSKHVPPGPPPLCSICQHKAPVFGKPPRRFSYRELELATGGFSQANFLAEGGFGSVHRGVLPDGQAVAVKQHKLASSQGDIEFCSEVEVLSCAQHRNVVMLIGYCIEDKRRLLVYEFVCNGSLDSHLYGRDKGGLEWVSRQKIAVGAARGLRYLHEECRVGCIVHRDMRPNNILLTHDYEPMVGDFGLARWQPDGDLGVQTRVIGTFGYLAPEYAQSGQITEKADVYSFGVVLLELATGRKAVDLNRPKGQQCLTEWARPLLDVNSIRDLMDPLLEGSYSDHEAYCMLHAASLCIRKDAHLRPRMSQGLRKNNHRGSILMFLVFTFSNMQCGVAILYLTGYSHAR
ncbi:hypothetical protein KP509_07G017500 [Ceratopteris richardii]|uniref:Protein kinase domain-containing protein n=1 Tax=Ceratopteris richardii TaxID=49495 RepID=A0A8T2UFL6_CERRI|nr:hypothetical protein KP509_07G017500 [Ceratopteris richardii]